MGFNLLVVVQGNALAMNLKIPALVDEFANGLNIRISISNVRLNELQHCGGGLIELNEHSVVDLANAKELQNLTAAGIQLVDTSVLIFKKNMM